MAASQKSLADFGSEEAIDDTVGDPLGAVTCALESWKYWKFHKWGSVPLTLGCVNTIRDIDL